MALWQMTCSMRDSAQFDDVALRKQLMGGTITVVDCEGRL